MAGEWTNLGPGPTYGRAATVSTSDSTPLSPDCRALWVGTGGNVVVVTESGDTVTFNAVPSGTLLPVRCSKVKATNTTASNIVALW